MNTNNMKPSGAFLFLPWFFFIPALPCAIFGAGEKTFSDKDTAFAMAEAAAAANIALQIRMRIESRIEGSENTSGRRADSVINIEALEKIPYRAAERFYREDTGTAFVLLELEL
jgi:hypothetical protein